MTRHRLMVVALLAALATVIGSSGSGLAMAAGQTDVLTIPASTVIRGNAGDVVELGRLTVDTTLAGPLCTWTATVTNQASVHPNSDILVESNGITLVVADVEATPNQVTSNTGSVSLASEVVVSIRLGPDGRFSGRMDVTIDYTSCGPLPSTTVMPTTSSLETSSTVEATVETTTAAPTTTEVDTTEDTTTSDTSTTEPEVAGPDVSAEDSTTTSEPPASETTAPATTTQVATPTTEDTDVLPVTGNGLTSPLVAGGLVAVGCGLALTAVARHRRSAVR